MSRFTGTTIAAPTLVAGAALAADEPKAPAADPKMQEMMAAWTAAACAPGRHFSISAPSTRAQS